MNNFPSNNPGDSGRYQNQVKETNQQSISYQDSITYGRYEPPNSQQEYSANTGRFEAFDTNSFHTKETIGHNPTVPLTINRNQLPDQQNYYQQQQRYSDQRTPSNSTYGPSTVDIIGSATLDRANQLLQSLHRSPPSSQSHNIHPHLQAYHDPYAATNVRSNNPNSNNGNIHANRGYQSNSARQYGDQYSTTGGAPTSTLHNGSYIPQQGSNNGRLSTASSHSQSQYSNQQQQHFPQQLQHQQPHQASDPYLHSQPRGALKGVPVSSALGARTATNVVKGVGGAVSQHHEQDQQKYDYAPVGPSVSVGSPRMQQQDHNRFTPYQSQMSPQMSSQVSPQGYSDNPSTFASNTRQIDHSLYEQPYSPNNHTRDSFSPPSQHHHHHEDFELSKRPYSNVSSSISAANNFISGDSMSMDNRKMPKFDIGQSGTSSRDHHDNLPYMQHSAQQSYAPRVSATIPVHSRSIDRTGNSHPPIVVSSHSRPVSTFEMMAAAKIGSGSIASGPSSPVASQSRRDYRHHSRSPSRARGRSVQERDRPSSNSKYGPSDGQRAPFNRRRSPSPASRPRDRSRRTTDATSGTKGNIRTSTDPTGSTRPSMTSQQKLDFQKFSIAMLAEKYNFPSISRYSFALGVSELTLRFSKLYLPSDLMRVEIDWHSISHGYHTDYFRNFDLTSPVLFTCSPAVAKDNCVFESDPPSMTYLTPEYGQTISSFNGSYLSSSYQHNNGRSIRFNARVILVFGATDLETDRVDFSLLKKLRVLIGRRKSSAMLLGGAWSQELDGGDPLSDRSCLLNTARRVVLAQSLVDIALFSKPLKLTEILYQRPREEVKGKVYPEQDEITCIYVCHVHRELDVSEEEFSCMWEHYTARVEGRVIAPFFNSTAADSAATLLSPPVETPAVLSASPVSEASVEFNAYSIDVAPQQQADEIIYADLKVEFDDELQREDGEEEEEKKGPEITVDSEAITDESTRAAVTTDIEVKPVTPSVEPQIKPKKPCVLICPQPISQEQEKNKQGVSVRVVSLSHLLTHSEDDSNERAFEVSLTAEILRSLLSIDFANIITDFIFAEHSQSGYYGDMRVPVAVSTLRTMLRNLNAKVGRSEKDQMKSDESVVKKPIDTALCESKEAENEIEIDIKVEEQEENMHENSAHSADAKELESKEADVCDTYMTDEIVVKKEVITEIGTDVDAAVTTTEEAVIPPEIDTQTGDDTDVNQLLPETEAKEWRKTFITACRWFDTEQLRFLRAEHLEHIIHTSTRYLRFVILSLAHNLFYNYNFIFNIFIS